jgi:hypothetical protein
MGSSEVKLSGRHSRVDQAQPMFGWCSAPPRPSIPYRRQHSLALSTPIHTPRRATSYTTRSAKPVENPWPGALDIATTMRQIALRVKHGRADSCICSAQRTRMEEDITGRHGIRFLTSRLYPHGHDDGG